MSEISDGGLSSDFLKNYSLVIKKVSKTNPEIMKNFLLQGDNTEIDKKFAENIDILTKDNIKKIGKYITDTIVENLDCVSVIAFVLVVSIYTLYQDYLLLFPILCPEDIKIQLKNYKNLDNKKTS